MRSFVVIVVVLLSACATQHPAPGSVVWLRADAGVVTDDGRVKRWRDQSGHGNDATMGTESRQPSLMPRAIGTKPVIRFGGAQSLTLDKPVSETAYTILLVGRNRMPGNEFSMILGPAGNTPNNQLRWEDGCHALFVGTGNQMAPVTVAIGDTRTAHILALRHGDRRMDVYRDGRQLSVPSVESSGPWVLGQIGAWYSKYFMVGDLAELLIYPTALSDAELAESTTYLRARYFKTVPPPSAECPGTP